MAGLDSKTVSLLHFDDDFTDVKDNIWTASGIPTISNAQSKFGGKSLYLDRKSYLTTDFSENFNVATGDFTVDWWEYPVSGASYPVTFSMDSATNDAGFVVGENIGGQRNCYVSSTLTSGWDVLSGFSLGTITNGVWTHFALVRRGDTFYGFRNGVLTSTTTSTKPIYCDATTRPMIGKRTNNGYDYWFLGYVDEFRFSKGIARWTSNFTPPTKQYSFGGILFKKDTTFYGLNADKTLNNLGAPTLKDDIVTLFKNNSIPQSMDNAMIDLIKTNGLKCVAWDADVDSNYNSIVAAVPKAQFIHEAFDIDLKLASYVDWVHVNDGVSNFEAGNGKVRMVVSRDSGSTWQTYNTATSKWDTILDTSNASDGAYDTANTERFMPGADAMTRLLASGMNVTTFNAAPFNDFTLAAGYKTLRVGYILSIDSSSDVAMSDSLKYQYDGVGNWVLGANWTHYKVQTRNNSHTLTWLSPINGTRVKVNY